MFTLFHEAEDYWRCHLPSPNANQLMIVTTLGTHFTFLLNLEEHNYIAGECLLLRFSGEFKLMIFGSVTGNGVLLETASPEE